VFEGKVTYCICQIPCKQSFVFPHWERWMLHQRCLIYLL
jgi:hypothetical protein